MLKLHNIVLVYLIIYLNLMYLPSKFTVHYFFYLNDIQRCLSALHRHHFKHFKHFKFHQYFILIFQLLMTNLRFVFMLQQLSLTSCINKYNIHLYRADENRECMAVQ